WVLKSVWTVAPFRAADTSSQDFGAPLSTSTTPLPAEKTTTLEPPALTTATWSDICPRRRLDPASNPAAPLRMSLRFCTTGHLKEQYRRFRRRRCLLFHGGFEHRLDFGDCGGVRPPAAATARSDRRPGARRMRCAGHFDRFLAVAVEQIGIGPVVEKILHQIRAGSPGCFMERRGSFIVGRGAGHVE